MSSSRSKALLDWLQSNPVTNTRWAVTANRRRGPAEVRNLYGRDHERAILADQLADTIAGSGSLVLVSGEAGIGKTALVEDLTRSARECGASVITGACFDLTTTPPYGPWIEAFSDIADRVRSPFPFKLDESLQ